MNETYYVITMHGDPFPYAVFRTYEEAMHIIKIYVQMDEGTEGWSRANDYDIYECKTTFCEHIRGEDIHE